MAMACALSCGVAEAGDQAEVLLLDDYVSHFLRDCRTCRGSDGRCTISDRYEELLIEHLLPADAVVLAAPVYWYGLPAQVKCVLDRLVCFTSKSYPQSERIVASLAGKRYALLLSSEESSYAMTTGIIQQVSDFCRYTHGTLVAVLNGVGNRRGEVKRDPTGPLGQAKRIGQAVFSLRATDFRIDTQRPAEVWQEGVQ
jgi:multimeric flavodoxin WrbA